MRSPESSKSQGTSSNHFWNGCFKWMITSKSLLKAKCWKSSSIHCEKNLLGWKGSMYILLGQWLNFKLFGITYLVGKIKFKLFLSGSIGWVRYFLVVVSNILYFHPVLSRQESWGKMILPFVDLSAFWFVLFSFILVQKITKNFRYLKWRYWTLFSAILGVGFPLHRPYPYSLYRWGFLHFRYLKCLVRNLLNCVFYLEEGRSDFLPNKLTPTPASQNLAKYFCLLKVIFVRILPCKCKSPLNSPPFGEYILFPTTFP